MGAALCQSLPAAADLFSRASAVLGYDLLAVCTAGPADRLNATDVSQPAIFVASLAALEQLRATEPEAFAPSRSRTACGSCRPAAGPCRPPPRPPRPA
jgi:[acyl-carrier-protein] S-malonyltransferase